MSSTAHHGPGESLRGAGRLPDQREEHKTSPSSLRCADWSDLCGASSRRTPRIRKRGQTAVGSVHERGRSDPAGVMRGSIDACAQTGRRAHPGRVHPAWAVPEAGRPRGDRLRRQGTDLVRRGPCERRAGDQARAAAAGWRCSGVRRPSGPRCPAARTGCRLSSRRYGCAACGRGRRWHT
jgi:hypothetical protein